MTPAADPASLENLHDIVEPAALSLWWPLAPGWWVILTLFTLGVAGFSYRWFQRWRADGYRRSALGELNALSSGVRLSELLKRVALVAYPRGRVASLTGREWVAFLNANAPQPCFDGELGDLLTSLAYTSRSISSAQVDALKTAAGRWIETHRPTEKDERSQ